MTCIVGIAQGGKVYIGGDSAGVGGNYSLEVRTDRKVFINGPAVMGFTTSFRMGQLLAYSFKVPKRHPDTAIMEYMVTDFIDDVRKCLKEGGFASKDKEVEAGGAFLVGLGGKLFTIWDDYQVGENECGYAAVGCGGDIALGSLHTSANAGYPEESEFDTSTRLKLALEAAATHSAGVHAPFHYVEGGA